MFGFIYMSAMPSIPPSNITDTFGNSLFSNETNVSYGMVHNVTAIETQGSGAGIIIVAACAVLVLVFAMVVLMRGAYSKNKYRT